MSIISQQQQQLALAAESSAIATSTTAAAAVAAVVLEKNNKEEFVDKKNEVNKSTPLPINYKNGRKKEPSMTNFTNYYNHREKLPKHYHPLVQYLESTEVKFHNDNLYEDSPIGFPTRAQ